MEPTKNASSSAFEQINKNLINNIRGERYMQCLGIYCWMKANAVYTDEYELHLGGNKSVTLKNGEISHSLSIFADIWKVSYNTASAIIREMVELGMIEIVGKVKGNTCGNRYIYKVKDFFCQTDEELSNFENKLSKNENKLSNFENKLSNFENKLSKNESKLSKNENKLSKFDHNNNTNNNTNNNKKEKEEKTSATSSTFSASADETNYDKAMTEDEELMKAIDKQYNNDYYDEINTTNVIMTKEDEEILRQLNNEKNETTMTNQHLLDFENLDDKAYFNKYGKSKPLSYDENKERKTLIYNELHLFNSQLKARGKSMTDEYIEHFKSHSELKPTDEEINTAIETLKKVKELKSKAA